VSKTGDLIMAVKKVLIVDDSATERHVLEQIMSEAGFVVITTSTGEEGVAKARAEMPTLVLMDVVMPGMNGYQATREIAKGKDTVGIPVIICTSRGAETDKLWGLRQGAQEYLVKPINKQALLQKVQKILSEK
jgi:twitching motility two-component system response regulator PilH